MIENRHIIHKIKLLNKLKERFYVANNFYTLALLS